MKKPEPATGIKRIFKACGYSLDGMNYAFKEEAAFRQEVILLIFGIVGLFFIDSSLILKLLILLAHLAMMVVELLNSSIEALVDKTTPEYHILAKRAKDMGSAAVLISGLTLLGLWALAFYEVFFARLF